MKKFYFKVKIGFGKDEYISINHHELSKALKAQINGGIVVFEEGSISGNNIISITPDYGRELGLNRSYTLTAQDYRQLDDNRVKSYGLLLHEATESVQNGIPKRAQDTKNLEIVENLSDSMRIEKNGR